MVRRAFKGSGPVASHRPGTPESPLGHNRDGGLALCRMTRASSTGRLPSPTTSQKPKVVPTPTTESPAPAIIGSSPPPEAPHETAISGYRLRRPHQRARRDHRYLHAASLRRLSPRLEGQCGWRRLLQQHPGSQAARHGPHHGRHPGHERPFRLPIPRRLACHHGRGRCREDLPLSHRLPSLLHDGRPRIHRRRDPCLQLLHPRPLAAGRRQVRRGLPSCP